MSACWLMANVFLSDSFDRPARPPLEGGGRADQVMTPYTAGFAGAGADSLVDTGMAGVTLVVTIATDPSGEIVTEGVSVVLIAAFCLLPSVPRFWRVSLALAARSAFCSVVSGFFRFAGMKPNL